MPALDRYDDRDIDDDVAGENFEEREEARLRAERAMDRAEGRRRQRLPGALLEGQPLLLTLPDTFAVRPANYAEPVALKLSHAEICCCHGGCLW